MSFLSLKQSRIYLMHYHEILRHCVTSLALENWGQKYCQTLGYKPNPSIPQCDFQSVTLPTVQKYWLLLKLKQHIKQLRMDRNSEKINLAKRYILCQKTEPLLVIWYSRTQTADSKHENRSNAWVADPNRHPFKIPNIFDRLIPGFNTSKFLEKRP